MRTIIHTQATRIINIACSSWQSKLAELWGKDIVLKKKINITDQFYKEMRNACTKEQHELFDKIFGKDEMTTNFKVGDSIVFLREVDGKRKGDLRKITHIEPDNRIVSTKIRGIWLNYEDGGFREGGNGYHEGKDFRKATPEEIRKATCIPEGTPCLVSDNKRDWNLRYADGNGKFYGNGEKSGMVLTWKYHFKLDPSVIADLPE